MSTIPPAASSGRATTSAGGSSPRWRRPASASSGATPAGRTSTPPAGCWPRPPRADRPPASPEPVDGERLQDLLEGGVAREGGQLRVLGKPLPGDAQAARRRRAQRVEG